VIVDDESTSAMGPIARLSAWARVPSEAVERTCVQPPARRSMSGEQVAIRTEDGVADGYLSRPADDDGRRPGVLFLVDAFGLRPQIEQMADRIAKRGFVVLAPNVFYRHGRAPVLPMPDLEDPQSRGPFMEKLRPMMQELTPELIASDSRGYLDFLAEVARGPFAITGYCMGARLGWRIATAHPDRVVALAGFHGGGLVTDDEDSPHRSAGELTVEAYFGHADNDQSMTPENIAALEQALDEADVTYRSEVYEGAAHGYTMADTSMYNEGAAERHYDALFTLLDRTI
jgi:carboxymethylenebutenolidase